MQITPLESEDSDELTEVLPYDGRNGSLGEDRRAGDIGHAGEWRSEEQRALHGWRSGVMHAKEWSRSGTHLTPLAN